MLTRKMFFNIFLFIATIGYFTNLSYADLRSNALRPPLSFNPSLQGFQTNMGKRATVNNIAPGTMALVVRDSLNNEHTVASSSAGTLDVSGLISTFGLMPDMDKNHLDIIKGILGLLGKESSIELRTFEVLVEDLFGYPSVAHGAIFLYYKLKDNPIALFYEIGEYLIEKGRLRLECVEPQGKNIVIVKDSHGKILYRLTLIREDARRQIEKDPKNPRHLLKAIEMEIFREYDVTFMALLKNIRSQEKLQFRLTKAEQALTAARHPLETDRKSKETELSSARDQLELTKIKLGNLEKELTDKATQKKNLEEIISGMEGRAKSLHDSGQEEASGQVHRILQGPKYRPRLAALNDEIEGLNQRIAQATAEVRDLTTMIVSLEQEVASMDIDVALQATEEGRRLVRRPTMIQGFIQTTQAREEELLEKFKFEAVPDKIKEIKDILERAGMAEDDIDRVIRNKWFTSQGKDRFQLSVNISRNIKGGEEPITYTELNELLRRNSDALQHLLDLTKRRNSNIHIASVGDLIELYDIMNKLVEGGTISDYFNRAKVSSTLPNAKRYLTQAFNRHNEEFLKLVQRVRSTCSRLLADEDSRKFVTSEEEMQLKEAAHEPDNPISQRQSSQLLRICADVIERSRGWLKERRYSWDKLPRKARILVRVILGGRHEYPGDLGGVIDRDKINDSIITKREFGRFQRKAVSNQRSINPEITETCERNFDPSFNSRLDDNWAKSFSNIQEMHDAIEAINLCLAYAGGVAPVIVIEGPAPVEEIAMDEEEQAAVLLLDKAYVGEGRQETQETLQAAQEIRARLGYGTPQRILGDSVINAVIRYIKTHDIFQLVDLREVPDIEIPDAKLAEIKLALSISEEVPVVTVEVPFVPVGPVVEAPGVAIAETLPLAPAPAAIEVSADDQIVDRVLSLEERLDVLTQGLEHNVSFQARLNSRQRTKHSDRRAQQLAILEGTAEDLNSQIAGITGELDELYAQYPGLAPGMLPAKISPIARLIGDLKTLKKASNRAQRFLDETEKALGASDIKTAVASYINAHDLIGALKSAYTDAFDRYGGKLAERILNAMDADPVFERNEGVYAELIDTVIRQFVSWQPIDVTRISLQDQGQVQGEAARVGTRILEQFPQLGPHRTDVETRIVNLIASSKPVQPVLPADKEKREFLMRKLNAALDAGAIKGFAPRFETPEDIRNCVVNNAIFNHHRGQSPSGLLSELRRMAHAFEKAHEGRNGNIMHINQQRLPVALLCLIKTDQGIRNAFFELFPSQKAKIPFTPTIVAQTAQYGPEEIEADLKTLGLWEGRRHGGRGRIDQKRIARAVNNELTRDPAQRRMIQGAGDRLHAHLPDVKRYWEAQRLASPARSTRTGS